ncbi:MAG: FAD-dependent oxidoreductase [Candidatus Omnitrophota bacterium]
MNQFRAQFTEKIPRVGAVESFRFKARGLVTFLAGQFIRVIFDETNKGNKDLNKYLSFSSAPGKDYIEVTKRLSESAFSGRLRALKPSEEVFFEGPLGNCLPGEQDTKVCFLAGGIGITPVISIIEDIVIHNRAVDVMVFYSNRTEEIAFKHELDAWRTQYCTLRVLHTVTDCQPTQAHCVFGTIDKELIVANLDDVRERTFFIFGPPGMVAAMKKVCIEAGIPEQRIKTEGFLGY